MYFVLQMPDPLPANPSPDLLRLIDMGARPGCYIIAEPGLQLAFVQRFEPGYIPNVLAAFDELVLRRMEPACSADQPRELLRLAVGLGEHSPPRPSGPVVPEPWPGPSE